ncbi:MAG: queuosine precursor transporter [Candidatus Hydrothermarchaeota archaeon]|nr:queuosine precursor transporter [Candidatus Hydrothermarchaeota archaeon]
MRKELAYASIGALFVTAQVLTAIRAEVFPFLPEPYNLMFGGLFAYILIYCVANILNESEGKREGIKIIVVGLFANILFLVNLRLENLIPEAKGIFPDYASQTFNWLVSTEVRIVAGSLLAYCIAMWLNNYLYNSKPERNLIVKYMLAIGAAQVIDTIVFHITAYLGLVEFNALVGSIFSTLVLKFIIAALSIPIFLGGLKGYSYIGVRLESKAVH